MAWPDIQITVGYVLYQAADLTPYINAFIGHDYGGLPDPFLVNGMTGNWAAPPAIAGNTYANMAAFEAAWYSANVGNTPITMTYPHFQFIGCAMDFPSGTTLEWGTAWSVGDLQTEIEFQAAGAGQTPEQYLAAQDAANRAAVGNPTNPGYCVNVTLQEVLVSPSPEGVIGPFINGVGIPPNDILGDCGPQTFEAGISAPIAVIFFDFGSSDFVGISQDKVSVNVTGNALGQFPHKLK